MEDHPETPALDLFVEVSKNSFRHAGHQAVDRRNADSGGGAGSHQLLIAATDRDASWGAAQEKSGCSKEKNHQATHDGLFA